MIIIETIFLMTIFLIFKNLSLIIESLLFFRIQYHYLKVFLTNLKFKFRNLYEHSYHTIFFQLFWLLNIFNLIMIILVIIICIH
jgi:hypothetical protein